MKGMAYGKFKRCAQNWQKTCDHEKRISWPVFGQNKIFEPSCFTFAPLFFVYFWATDIFWDSLTFSIYFFDIFSSLRSRKELTTKKMSLNNWKAWHVENSKDVLKIGKKHVTTKRGSRDQFLAKIKIFEPSRFTFAPLFFIYFGLLIFFWDSLTFSFYFFDIFSSLRSTKEVTMKIWAQISERRGLWKIHKTCSKLAKNLWPRKEDLMTSFWPK